MKRIYSVWDVDMLRVLCADHMGECVSDYVEMVSSKDLSPVCDVCQVKGEFND